MTLLPAIADALHVTVDALFGREESKLEEMPRQLARWLDSIPPKDRLSRLFELLVGSFTRLAPMDAAISNILEPMAAILPTCYTDDGTWLRSGLFLEGGMAMGVFSEDFPLYLLLPEPAAGYASQFAPTEDYRALFTVLSREGTLELLYYLYGHEGAFYTIPALSDRTGLPMEQITPILDAMEKCHLMKKTTIETQSGSAPVYALNDNGGLAPFLYLARWFMEKDYAWYLQWHDRDRPLLVPADDRSLRPKGDKADLLLIPTQDPKTESEKI